MRPSGEGASGIVLIGFMGTGKTVVGQRLAGAMGVPFVDTDALIEAKTNTSIPLLFKTRGENSFREIEKQVI